MSVKRSSHLRPALLGALITLMLALVANPAMSQTLPDTQPPIIEIEALAESVADNTQVFAAQIAEDRLLRDATLYHRRQGQDAFIGATMKPLGDTGYYSVSVMTDPTDLRTIEYYVQARDESGNRTVSGFAFDPFQRQILPASARIATNTSQSGTTSTGVSTTSEPIKPALQRSWVRVALGVLAVGVIASAVGGGSSSSGPTQNITLNVPDPNL